MSTPRHEPLMPPETIWLQIGEDEPGVENKSFSEFRDEVTWCWHKINDNDLEYRLVAEGVAAPLEPSQLESEARKFRIIDKGFRDGTMLSGTWIDKVMAEFAAAVSKNLQQSVEQLCGDLKAIQQDYTNEKKRADKLQEERDKLKAELDLVDEALARRPALAHIEHRYNKIFAACAGAAKSERLEREIAALRETKP